MRGGHSCEDEEFVEVGCCLRVGITVLVGRGDLS